MTATPNPTPNPAAPPLTPLQSVALRLFADHGFRGASLSRIAAEAGIKAPSIYAHFKGKDDLFLSLLGPAIDHELRETARALARRGAPEKRFRAHLVDIGRRFEGTPHMRFLLQTLYMAPDHLFLPVQGRIRDYMARNDALVRRQFAAMTPRALGRDLLATAYLGIIDSLQAELIFCGLDQFNTRLAALWAVFSLALKEKKKKETTI